MNSAEIQPIRVLVVDDHAMFRDGIIRVLESDPAISVVGQSGSATEAVALLEKSSANMILLDADLGSERALDFVVRAKKKGFEGKILVVTVGVTEPEAVDLVRAGIAGILHKVHSANMLCATIHRVAAGEVYLEQDYLTALFHSVDRTRTALEPGFTQRERAILQFVCQGMTNKDMGIELSLSESAVKASLRHLFDKLGVRTRAQLVKIALEQYRDQLYRK
jgi:two-component system nitrate/nitrite response regulator NarL